MTVTVDKDFEFDASNNQIIVAGNGHLVGLVNCYWGKKANKTRDLYFISYQKGDDAI